MGYTSYFNGEIKLKDRKAIKILKYLIKEQKEPFDWNGSYITLADEGTLNISGVWKNYEEDMEKICYFIKSLDKDAEGEISCDGEDSFDFWKIEINKRGVEILKGEVVYEFKKNYKDKDTKEQANKIFKDKQLNRKIILSQLST